MLTSPTMQIRKNHLKPRALFVCTLFWVTGFAWVEFPQIANAQPPPTLSTNTSEAVDVPYEIVNATDPCVKTFHPELRTPTPNTEVTSHQKILDNAPNHTDVDIDTTLQKNLTALEEMDLFSGLLRLEPGYGSTVELFLMAQKNSEFRKALNQKLQSSKIFKKKTEDGKKFREELASFVKVKDGLTVQMGSMAALYPAQDVANRLQLFLESSQSKQTKPLTEVEAERYARVDTANQYGLSDQFNSTELQQNPSARTYFERRKNYYLNQDSAQLTRNPKLELERYRFWLSSTIQQYQLEMAQVWHALLTEVKILTNKKVTFNLFGIKGLSGPDILGLNYNVMGWSNFEINPSKIKPENINFEKARSPVVIHSGKRIDISSITSNLKIAKVLIPNTNETIIESDDFIKVLPLKQDRPINFDFDFDRLPNALQSVLLKRAPRSFYSQVTVQLNIDSVFEALSQLTNKSASPLNLNSIARLQARLLYLKQLQDQVENFKTELEKPNLKLFIIKTQQAQKEEVQSRLGFSTGLLSGNLLHRLRALESPVPNDLVTGMEWYGYSINHAFWFDRDRNYGRVQRGEYKKNKPTLFAPQDTKYNFVGASPILNLDRELESQKTESALKKLKSASSDGWWRSSRFARRLNRTVFGVAIVGLALTGIKKVVPQLFSAGGASSTQRDEKPPMQSLASDEARDLPIQNELLKTAHEQAFYEVNVHKVKAIPETHHGQLAEEDFTDARPVFLPPKPIPRNFTFAKKGDLKQANHFHDITRQVQLTNNWMGYSFRHAGQFLKLTDTIAMQQIRLLGRSFLAVDGYLTVPKPKGYHLVEIFNYDFEPKRILQDLKTGNILIQVADEDIAKENNFSFNVVFNEDSTTSPFDQEIPSDAIPTPHNHQITNLKQLLKDAGLNDLANGVNANTTVEQLEDLISRTQIYSLLPGKGNEWLYKISSNPFSKFQCYLQTDSLGSQKLHMKCDRANELLTLMIKELYADQPSVQVESLVSIPYFQSNDFSDEGTELNRKHGYLAKGHTRTLLTIQGLPGRKILDATPITQADGSPADIYNFNFTQETEKKLIKQTELDQRKKQRQNRRNFKHATEMVMNRRDANLSSNSSPNGEAGTETQVNELADAAYEAEVLESKRLALKQQVEKMDSMAKNLLIQPTFKRWVETDPKHTKLAQKIYILTKTLIRYEQAEIPFSTLQEKINDYFGSDVIQAPATPEDLPIVFKQIENRSIVIWNQLKTKSQNRTSEQTWTLDTQLEYQVLELLRHLSQHEWVKVD
jgi:hypothetical protein